MAYYFINTDWNARRDIVTCDFWFQHGMAFTGDHEGHKWQHANLFKKLKPGDILFMYHSKRDNRNHKKKGYVGIGEVYEMWDGRSYEKGDRILYRKERYEYRIGVKWCKDWRDTPKDHYRIRMPITPATWGRIDEKRYPARDLLEKTACENKK